MLYRFSCNDNHLLCLYAQIMVYGVALKIIHDGE